MQQAKSNSPGTGWKETIDKAIAAGLRGLFKPEPLTLSQWADKHFYLSPESSSVEGAWETLPPQKGIMDVISNDDVECVTWRKSARTGYTKIIVAAICYFGEHKKRNTVTFQPTDTDSEDFVKDEVAPAFRDVDVIRDIFPDLEKKSKNNTLSKKVFKGSTHDFRGGESPRNYRRLTKDVAIYDELSSFKRDIGGEGKPTDLGDVRITTSSFPKSIRGSTPKIEGTCQITDSLNEADIVLRYHIPCPHCERLQVLEWGGRDADFGLKWDDDEPDTAHYLCRHCGDKFVYPDMPKVWDRGKWLSDDGRWIDPDGDLRDSDGNVVEFPAHVGFDRYSSLYSIFFTWPQMVDTYLKAVRKVEEGDNTKLKVFINTRLGETWKEEVAERPSDEILYSRREEYNADMPNEVLYITAGIDTQDNRFEFEVVGWGADEQSWSIEYTVLMGEMTQPQIWSILGEMLRKQYRRADGLLLPISRICHDSGGHYTDEVYKFSRAQGVHWVIPTKGANVYGVPIVDFPKKPTNKGVYLTIVGTDGAKDLIYGRLALKEKGPGYSHFPIKEGMYDENHFRGLTCEFKKLDYSRGRPVYRYVCPNGKRNEPLDCRVGALAALRLSQQYFGLDLAALQQHTAREAPRQEQRRKSSYWDKS